LLGVEVSMENVRQIVPNPFGGYDVLDPARAASIGNFPSVEQAKAVAEGSLLRAGGGTLKIILNGVEEQVVIEELGLLDLVRD
jgi:hypothetical protein